MKAKFLPLLPIACLLFSCSAPEGRDAPGGSTTFTAASLPLSPSKVETETTIEGHSFTYFNVYRDEQDDFVLKDATSYIRNFDIAFALRFESTLAVAYDIHDGKDGSSPCDSYARADGGVDYSVYYGFEIAIDKSAAETYTNVNIGKLEHWC